MTAFPAILTPEPSDNEDVVSALETADIFWTKGDTDEALRWLKRAAETASDAGNDMRALAIARSAADLKSVPVSPTPAASPPAAAEPPSIRMSRPPPPSAVARQAPAAPSSMASGSGEAPARAHTSAAPQKAPPPLPPSKARESVAPAAAAPNKIPTAAPAAPSATGPSAPLRSASTDRMAAVSPESRPVALSPTRSAPPAAAAPTPAEAPVRRAATSPSTLPKEPHRALTPATAYRAVAVFVKPQGRNGEKLEVILAKPGQPVPAGAEPALLVPTRRGGRLLG